ncbi:MAG: DUF3095 domain-containing protein [Bdellovibrionales bacterium]|nr:DUF3095 domain-containing protein [Bdellovibrionales bacterium]
MENFYLTIPSFKNFNGITSEEYFRPVPQDWAIFITDVRGSTKAIADGKYKDVNTIGAASIVVARKAMGKDDFPFVFGGDGATLLIPPSKIKAVSRELCALKRLSLQNFNLDLRVGMVKISELYAQNKLLEAAKYELTPGRCVAILRGEGMNQAETWIKEAREKYEVNDNATCEADLTGLSCRWQPIPSKRGKILSLIVYSRKTTAIYQNILKIMETIFPEGIESLNPANTELGSYKSIWKCMKDEIKYHPNIFSLTFLKRFMEIVPAVLIFKYKLPIPFIRRYVKAMETHSDFRKFDNMLRMVIDCTPNQVLAINQLLTNLHLEGDIFFGTFQSDNSLMTCFVDGLTQGQHIHFMDAENGGYAAASIQMKAQIKKSIA